MVLSVPTVLSPHSVLPVGMLALQQKEVCIAANLGQCCSWCIGQKRKHSDEGGLVELARIFQQAEERDADRDERNKKFQIEMEMKTREKELEMEERFREREARMEERMMTMFGVAMEMVGRGGPSRPIEQHPPYPSSQQPLCSTPRHPMDYFPSPSSYPNQDSPP